MKHLFWAIVALLALAFGTPAGLDARSGASVKIMIFGGDGHKFYLGCLSCSEYASDSVFNSYGTHGSAYSSESILNHYSQFGSPYSMYSACSPYASDPPVVVDGNGAFYGRLTVNDYNSRRLRSERVNAWLAAVCEH